MSKRRANRAPDAHQIDELIALGMDELHALKRVTGSKVQAATLALNAAIRENSAVSAAIKALRTNEPHSFGVSDHAVLRYLQRVEGMDISAVREKIRAMAKPRLDPKAPADQIIQTDGLSLAVYDGRTVATLWTDEDKDTP